MCEIIELQTCYRNNIKTVQNWPDFREPPATRCSTAQAECQRAEAQPKLPHRRHRRPRKSMPTSLMIIKRNSKYLKRRVGWWNKNTYFTSETIKPKMSSRFMWWQFLVMTKPLVNCRAACSIAAIHACMSTSVAAAKWYSRSDSEMLKRNAKRACDGASESDELDAAQMRKRNQRKKEMKTKFLKTLARQHNKTIQAISNYTQMKNETKTSMAEQNSGRV